MVINILKIHIFSLTELQMQWTNMKTRIEEALYDGRARAAVKREEIEIQKLGLEYAKLKKRLIALRVKF